VNAQSRITSDLLDTFLPGCSDEERALRERIMRARDLATTRVTSLQSSHARSIAWIIVETATEWVFQPARLEQLRDVANHLTRLLMCAGFAEQMEVGNAG